MSGSISNRVQLAFALLIVSVTLAAVGLAGCLLLRDSPRGALAIYVEEPEFELSGRKAQEIIANRLHALFPDDPVAWHFIVSRPDDTARVHAEIERLRPSIVVLANDTFVSLVENLPALPETSFIIPSGSPAAVIAAKYGQLRAKRQVAFISWDSPNHTKTLELGSKICGGPVRSLVALFHEEHIAEIVHEQFLRAAEHLGLSVHVISYSGWSQFESALRDAVAAKRPDALYVPISSDLLTDLQRGAELITRTGIPAVHSRRDQVWAGGLVSSDAPNDEAHEQIALYAGLIVRGARASGLEVAQPSTFETAINLVSAKRIGCRVPYELLIEATEVVER